MKQYNISYKLLYLVIILFSFSVQYMDFKNESFTKDTVKKYYVNKGISHKTISTIFYYSSCKEF